MIGEGLRLPKNLLEVHLVVEVAGLRQFFRFEATPALTYAFGWNRTDGYNRTVYGTVPAKGNF